MSQKNIEDIYPLSPLQQGILFHTLYASEPGTYFVQVRDALGGAVIPAYTSPAADCTPGSRCARATSVGANGDEPRNGPTAPFWIRK